MHNKNDVYLYNLYIDFLKYLCYYNITNKGKGLIDRAGSAIDDFYSLLVGECPYQHPKKKCLTNDYKYVIIST